MFTDGPFVESKEYLAGVWIMEAADLDWGDRNKNDVLVDCLQLEDRGAGRSWERGR